MSACFDVVLFQPGSFRVGDNVGLSKCADKCLPLCILDDDSFECAARQQITRKMIFDCVSDIDRTLKNILGKSLTVLQDDTFEALITSFLSTTGASETDEITIHYHDSGSAINSMNYNGVNALLSLALPANFKLSPWSSCVIDGSEHYDGKAIWSEFKKSAFYYSNSLRSPPLLAPKVSATFSKSTGNDSLDLPSNPSPTTFSGLWGTSWGGFDLPSNPSPTTFSGLWGTSWGGFNGGCVSETAAHESLNAATAEDYLVNYFCPRLHTNQNSLEHHAMNRMSSDGTDSSSLIPSEALLRTLLAPLLLGCVSTKQLYHWGMEQQNKQMCETALAKDWHVLLAELMAKRGHDYRYWQFQGNLCRYKETKPSSTAALSTALTAKSFVLVHGFGASSSHFDKMRKDLACSSNSQILTPDLLGFGHSEKPAITHTQYSWESYVKTFASIFAESSFVLGGNSIGGYSAMGAAADLGVDGVTADGAAPAAEGQRECTDLLLFNTAGVVRAVDDPGVDSSIYDENYRSVADRTSSNELPPFTAPGRLTSYLSGHLILSSLRLFIGPLCKWLYPFAPEEADRKLIDDIYRDSLDPGAIHVMVSGAKLPPPRTANELLGSSFAGGSNDFVEGRFGGGVFVIQGTEDPLNDAKTRAKNFGKLRSGVRVEGIAAGHCVHDEKHHECVEYIINNV